MPEDGGPVSGKGLIVEEKKLPPGEQKDPPVEQVKTSVGVVIEVEEDTE